MLDNLDEAHFYLRMEGKEDVEDERDYDLEAKDVCETS